MISDDRAWRALDYLQNLPRALLSSLSPNSKPSSPKSSVAKLSLSSQPTSSSSFNALRKSFPFQTPLSVSSPSCFLVRPVSISVSAMFILGVSFSIMRWFVKDHLHQNSQLLFKFELHFYRKHSIVRTQILPRTCISFWVKALLHFGLNLTNEKPNFGNFRLSWFNSFVSRMGILVKVWVGRRNAPRSISLRSISKPIPNIIAELHLYRKHFNWANPNPSNSLCLILS